MTPLTLTTRHLLANLILALAAQHPTTDILDAIAVVESGGQVNAIGDNGRSRGIWQMQRSAWDDVSKRRRKRGDVTWSWIDGTRYATINRTYALDHINWLEVNLKRLAGRQPTSCDLLAVWQLGLTGYQRRGFDIARCPKRVRDAARLLQQLVST